MLKLKSCNWGHLANHILQIVSSESFTRCLAERIWQVDRRGRLNRNSHPNGGAHAPIGRDQCTSCSVFSAASKAAAGCAADFEVIHQLPASCASGHAPPC